jgi:hypothetical protein
MHYESAHERILPPRTEHASFYLVGLVGLRRHGWTPVGPYSRCSLIPVHRSYSRYEMTLIPVEM